MRSESGCRDLIADVRRNQKSMECCDNAAPLAEELEARLRPQVTDAMIEAGYQAALDIGLLVTPDNVAGILGDALGAMGRE